MKGRYRAYAGMLGVGSSIAVGVTIELWPHQYLYGLLLIGVALSVWGLLPVLVGTVRDEPEMPAMNNQGTFAGRDNTGTQQVFQGPITIHHAIPESAERSIPSWIEPDVTLGAAFWRAFLGTWDKPPHGDLLTDPVPWTGYWDQFYSFISEDVRQAAFDGKLPVWGRATNIPGLVNLNLPKPVLQPIPKDYWKQNWIEVLQFIHDDYRKILTQPDAFAPKAAQQWFDLSTNRATVERLWPNGASGGLPNG